MNENPYCRTISDELAGVGALTGGETLEAHAGSSENIRQISEELLAHRCGISDAIVEGSGVLLDSVVVVLLVPCGISDAILEGSGVLLDGVVVVLLVPRTASRRPLGALWNSSWCPTLRRKFFQKRLKFTIGIIRYPVLNYNTL